MLNKLRWFAVLLFVIKAVTYVGAQCENEEIVIADCDEFTSLSNLLDYGDDAEYTITGPDGPVPYPIPALPRYLCSEYTVVRTGPDGETCTYTLKISMATGPEVEVVPFTSISAQNYNKGEVPRPIVRNCTYYRPGGYQVSDYYDKFISTCNQVPRVTRTWTFYDKCLNATTVEQTFDIISDLACTIIGPTSVPLNREVEINSRIGPRGLPPYNSNWSLIGTDWAMKTFKSDPTRVTLTPGPSATDAILRFELFDRLGCKTFCEKRFNAIRNKTFNLTENTMDDFIINSGDKIVIRLNPEVKYHYIRTISSSGQVLNTWNAGQINGDEIEIPKPNRTNAIYFIQMYSSEGQTTHKLWW